VNKIAMELENALKIIEILKEELDIADASSSAKKVPYEIVKMDLKYL
jgi:hypothetical protein